MNEKDKGIFEEILCQRVRKLTEVEYNVLKEKIKDEVLKELKGKKEVSINTIVREEQNKIFNQYFPRLREENPFKYWKLKETVIKLTNLCRYRDNETGSFDSSIHSKEESESAIETYSNICELVSIWFKNK